VTAPEAIDTSQRFRLSERLLLKEDGEETLVFDPISLAVHQLNESAAAVARMCDGETSCEQMVASLVERFGLELGDAARIVYEGLRALRDKELFDSP
jgi:hypothetical protein